MGARQADFASVLSCYHVLRHESDAEIRGVDRVWTDPNDSPLCSALRYYLLNIAPCSYPTYNLSELPLSVLHLLKLVLGVLEPADRCPHPCLKTYTVRAAKYGRSWQKRLPHRQPERIHLRTDALPFRESTRLRWPFYSAGGRFSMF